jgi:hypothetical protein
MTLPNKIKNKKNQKISWEKLVEKISWELKIKVCVEKKQKQKKTKQKLQDVIHPRAAVG